MDYYFQDQLRWTLGFDNPNKAAALLATLIPILWIFYSLAWRVPQKAWRWFLIILFAGILLTGWWLLIKTYSRGGLVAAILASGYILWQTRGEWKWMTTRTTLSGVIMIIVCAVSIWSGAANRGTQWIGGNEGSVENRYAIWQGGLRMIASIPQGVGMGNSGRFYMQWFQPLESTARYRTLVNSHLTFCVEQGIIVFAASLFAVSILWLATRPVSFTPPYSKLMACGLSASLLSFAVSGFFSTTMEEPILWVIPAVAFVMLVFLSMKSLNVKKWPVIIVLGLAFSSITSSLLLFTGKWLNRNHSLIISMEKIDNGSNTVIVTPANVFYQKLAVAVDAKVMGEDYGKLVRRLSTNKNTQLTVFNNLQGVLLKENILVAGDQVFELQTATASQFILLAPEITEDRIAERILKSSQSVKLLLPDFDEDGRVEFWKEMTEKYPNSKTSVTVLIGIGSRVDWGWETVMDKLVE